MNDKEFNLLYEPWIKTYTKHGENTEYSILNVFKNAHHINSLAGELPTQDFAILRLLLAILHAAFGKRREGFIHLSDNIEITEMPSDRDLLQRWKFLWDKGEFPFSIIEKYLKEYQERFFLFHPKKPFMQVTDLCDDQGVIGHPGENESKNLANLVDLKKFNNEINESGNSVRLYKTRNGQLSGQLSYAEAARWLVHAHAFSDSDSIKKLYYSKKEYGKVTGKIAWCGRIGGIYATGKNLFETLMLNLVMLPPIVGTQWGEEYPLWEQEDDVVCWTKRRIEPNNLSQLLTVLSYRIELVRDEAGVVSSVLMQQGVPLRLLNKDQEEVSGLDNRVRVIYMDKEQMTSWRRDGDSLDPKQLAENRQVWRDFPSLLKGIGSEKKAEVSSGLMKWLSRLEDEDYLSTDFTNISTVGMTYSSRAAISNIIEDRMTFSRTFLRSSPLADEWLERISETLNRIEKAVSLFGQLYRQVEIAKGFNLNKKTISLLKSKRAAAEEIVFSALDIPFRRWLGSINPEKNNETESIRTLYDALISIILDQGKQFVINAGTGALVGRVTSVNNKQQVVSSAKYLNIFIASVKKL